MFKWATTPSGRGNRRFPTGPKVPCSVTDYEVPNKSEWVQYRAALRDVTLQTDPFEIVWPLAPEA